MSTVKTWVVSAQETVWGHSPSPLGLARFRGFELCEPCQYLAKLTGKAQVLPGLVHRGGLRAEVLADGEVQVGAALLA